jgi:hypothetical protein|tara:strand:+ start:2657 stop:2860 length:204 start_codon:yes stop_codon:yes gene_type:complete
MTKPEAGKVYALTSATGPCIANGNSWEESIVPMTLDQARAIADDKEDAKRQANRLNRKPFIGQKCRD